VEEQSAHSLLNMVELEAWNYARCLKQAKSTEVASSRISWLSAAIESAFANVEMAGRLREFHPDAANNLAYAWRNAAADLCVRRHEVVQNARAELIA
jgi:hypothetical protein